MARGLYANRSASDKGVAAVPLESLTKHRAAIDAVLRAFEVLQRAEADFQTALHALPEFLQDEVGRDLEEMTAYNPAPQPPRAPSAETESLALRPLILMTVAKQPGMTLEQIVTATAGKFRTTSKNPVHLVRTVVGQLVRNADLIRDDDGKHTVSPFADVPGEGEIPF